jgi:structure-specific recognition protein 1
MLGQVYCCFQGKSWDVFSKVLKGLSGAKLSRAGKFRSSAGGVAVSGPFVFSMIANWRGGARSRTSEHFRFAQIRCSLKADEGYLYPLERGFMAVHKPPALLPYDDVDYVEFERQGQGGSMGSAKTFDLYVRLKTDVSCTISEHVFLRF